MDWQAISLSVRLAACTTLVLVALGIPLALWLATTRWRWRFLLEAVVALPLVLPPTVLGFYVLMAVGPHSPVGRFYEALFGQRLPFSFEGLLVASVLYSLPFAVQPLMAAFSGIDRRLLEASFVLGRGWVSTVTRVVLPLSRVGLVTAIVLTFAHTVGEFGVVLMIGGNIPGSTQVISTEIYTYVEAMEYGKAHVLAGGMLVFSFFVLLSLNLLNRKEGRNR